MTLDQRFDDRARALAILPSATRTASIGGPCARIEVSPIAPTAIGIPRFGAVASTQGSSGPPARLRTSAFVRASIETGSRAARPHVSLGTTSGCLRMDAMAIEIRQQMPGKDTRDFVRAGLEVFRSDRAWVAPLRMMIEDRLNPRKDPCHAHVDAVLFTAWKDGALVGRVSASVDRAWLAQWKDDTGHFGYFDTINDEEIARALLARV